MTDVRVVIAEDSFLLREGLQQLLELTGEIEVVAACGSFDDLLADVDTFLPDVVLTDIRMPPTHTDEGVRAALEVRARHPGIGVVVLSEHASPAYALALLGTSSTGLAYLLKHRVSDVDQIVGAMRAVASGGSVVDSDVVRSLIEAQSVASGSRLSELTERELEVLAAMAQGMSNSAIAASTFAADRTIEKRISSIFSKLLLPDEPDTNRRVRAALVYLTESSGSGVDPASGI
jgi:DNA-binding NarL/FixJ family response regulator